MTSATIRVKAAKIIARNELFINTYNAGKGDLDDALERAKAALGDYVNARYATNSYKYAIFSGNYRNSTDAYHAIVKSAASGRSFVDLANASDDGFVTVGDDYAAWCKAADSIGTRIGEAIEKMLKTEEYYIHKMAEIKKVDDCISSPDKGKPVAASAVAVEDIGKAITADTGHGVSANAYLVRLFIFALLCISALAISGMFAPH